MSYHDNEDLICIACATVHPAYYVELDSNNTTNHICMECGEWNSIHSAKELCDIAWAFLNRQQEEDDQSL